ncbi:hypothetical protein AB1L07_01875 [Niallia alba]|uniref:hypothetical protein n=1 Tax=Niallia alba TaxID=2729105 RepID=UPI0039A11A80
MRDYSNYHNVNVNEKLREDGLFLLEHSLNGFESYEAFVNGSPTSVKVLIYQKYDSDSETKRVIGHISDIERGNILNINEQDWLVVTIPEDNKIYRKADMKICNSFFPAITDKTRVLIGRDDDGRPVYEEIEQKVYVPCIVEPSISINTDKVDQLLLPKGSIKISLKYAKYMNINSNDKFEMYANRYEIEDIDYSKVINEIGIMVIYAKKDVKES